MMNIFWRFKTRVEKQGYLSTIKLLMIHIVGRIVAFPIALILYLITPVINVRFIRLFSMRIGHYAQNTEFMLYAIRQNVFDQKNKVYNLYYNIPFEPICNLQLYKMWKREIPIIPFPVIASFIDKYLGLFKGNSYINDPIKKTFESTLGGHDKWNFLANIKEPLLSFTTDEELRGEKVLSKMGIKDKDKFVCLMMRDSGYLSKQLPDNDWSYHDYRDVQVENYLPAAEWLASQGYYVLRMGKYVNKKFISISKMVIDYANSEFQSDFMDIYLSSHCVFMISTSCGLDSVAQIFRRPLLITDFPLSELKTWYYWDMFILKNVYDENRQRLLKYSEIYQERNDFDYKRRMLDKWKKNGWRFVDNSADEILDAVKDMLGLINLKSNPLTEQQKRFWSNFPLTLPAKIDDYAGIKMRLGIQFAHKYTALIN